MNRVIVIIGPTAVGKTQISIDLAHKFETQIISGDSMLVYKEMDIGTAKPNIAERQGIVHHLIDIREPNEDFNVVDFITIAAQHIQTINDQKRIPIVAGGTGLYIKALLEGYQFSTTSSSEQLRKQYDDLARKHGNQHVHNLLEQVSPETAARLHPNDLRRIIRALEVYHLGGDTVSQSRTYTNDKAIYDAVVIGLSMDRPLLYERINQRVDCMIASGLVNEVTLLLAKGLSINSQAMQGIGYKEIVRYLHGEYDLVTATNNIKQATRNFAKRQLTWYRKMNYVEWFDVFNISHRELVERITEFIKQKYTLR